MCFILASVMSTADHKCLILQYPALDVSSFRNLFVLHYQIDLIFGCQCKEKGYFLNCAMKFMDVGLMKVLTASDNSCRRRDHVNFTI